MTVRELIKALLDQPLDAQAYVGKGIGPAATVALFTAQGVVVISPGGE
jgi:hypothetical protein